MKALVRVITAVVPWIMVACSVVPEPPPDNSLPPMPFAEMVAGAGQFLGKTAILGGSVLDVVNLKDQTRLEALHVPLGVGQKPKDKDLSEGRLIIEYPGFLDPEVYTKGRLVTVTGKLLGSSASEENDKPFPYLRLLVMNLHLWPIEKPRPPDPYWDPFWYPYPWYWRHPHYWHD